MSSVIPKPDPEDWSWLDATVGILDEDFVQATREEPVPQERSALEACFIFSLK